MRRRLAIAIFAIAGLAACSNDNNSSENLLSPPASISGVYTLQTINGQPLPYTYPNGLVLTSLTSTLNDDGSCTSQPVYSSNTPSPDHCTYTYDSNTGSLTVTFPSGIKYIGSGDGLVASLEFDGSLGVWRRQP